MSGEKKHWRMSTHFQRFSGKQPLPKVRHPRSSISSVYLSGDTTTSGFIVVPEFDDVSRARRTAYEEFNHTSHVPMPPGAMLCDPLPIVVHEFLHDLEPVDPNYSSYLSEGSCGISVPSTSLDVDDLSQRLLFAYEHISSMSSTISPKVSLSSDPQILRQQLGVPQHSVLNYPSHSSPDLPNPHTYPRESTYSKLSPPASPDVSPARTSRRLTDLCINTEMHSISPRNSFPDSFQPVQRRHTVIVSESSSSPRRALEAPSNACTACPPKLQPAVSKPSKLIKRRVDKPVISPSLPPPSRRRQGSKGVLRKPPPDTPPSTNAHTRQISLPQVKPPSPFKVDMPLHHTWHDRRSNLNFSPKYHPKMPQSHEAKSRRSSGNTDALASLAWIGNPSTSYTTNGMCRLANPGFLPDVFSMATTMEDDGMSDKALVNRLEEVRGTCSEGCRGHSTSGSWSPNNTHLSSARKDEDRHPYTSCLSTSPPIPDQLAESCNVPFPSSSRMHTSTSDSEDAEIRRAARKALLCIREIICSERKYQEAMRMLLNAQTATPPPPSMAPYISALVRVSETLLRCFIEDPSAWGISTAFVASEDELEATMVSWCAIAGVLFVDGDDPRSSGLIGRWRQRKFGAISSSSSSTMKQSSISLSLRLSSVFSMTSTGGRARDRADEEGDSLQHHQTEQDGHVFTTPTAPENTNNQTLTDEAPGRKLSVRDLAIQPIQRVVRYVLLYRDLLECTPPTLPPRLLVERALEAATRIAEHCDSAQQNPAFVRAP